MKFIKTKRKMTREQIEKAAKEAVQDHFQCNGKYPCEERDYCEFCNGHNSAFNCNEDCGADDFNEGFIAGAQWHINAVWHDRTEKADTSKELILMYPNGLVRVILLNPNLTFDGFLSVDAFIKWAYVSDLLPERKEETNGGR